MSIYLYSAVVFWITFVVVVYLVCFLHCTRPQLTPPQWDETAVSQLVISYTSFLEHIPAVMGRRTSRQFIAAPRRKTNTRPFTLTHTCRELRVSNLPDMYVFGLWEKARVSGENPRRCREKMQTAQL